MAQTTSQNFRAISCFTHTLQVRSLRRTGMGSEILRPGRITTFAYKAPPVAARLDVDVALSPTARKIIQSIFCSAKEHPLGTTEVEHSAGASGEFSYLRKAPRRLQG
jgi:hypothetical protein